MSACQLFWFFSEEDEDSRLGSSEYVVSRLKVNLSYRTKMRKFYFWPYLETKHAFNITHLFSWCLFQLLSRFITSSLVFFFSFFGWGRWGGFSAHHCHLIQRFLPNQDIQLLLFSNRRWIIRNYFPLTSKYTYNYTHRFYYLLSRS